MTMHWLDYAMVALFFIVMVFIGLKSLNSVKSSEDFFVGGGKIPWWLSGISHHVSGYSGVVFVAYAGIAYTHGISIYFWWGVNIAVAMALSAIIIAPRWPRLRRTLGIQSPTEYLRMRYNTSAQLIVAISGIVVKLLDVGAKWASMGILLYGFTGLPIWLGIVVSSLVSLVYISIGGLVADLWTDFAQFVVQVVAGLALFFGVLLQLGARGLNFFTVFSQLPDANTAIFNAGRGQGSLSWTLLYFFVIFFSYSGGTWNLAARFIATPDDKQAKNAALLSSALYLVWPFILFFPMWAGPLIFPGLTRGEAEANLYAMLTNEFLPVGMIGLVLASMFANTLSMCTSDANTISAVLTRDVLPIFKPELRNLTEKKSLYYARATTIAFTSLTILVALFRDQLGGVSGLILTWFAALLGPTAIPLLFGLLPQFKYADAKAAIASMIGGLGVFVMTKMGLQLEADIALIAPLATSFIIFGGMTLLNKYVLGYKVPDEIEQLMTELGKEDLAKELN
ncbi:sodium:solute symporter family protein [Natronincola ferrireducens]|uniref:Na+/proline symporter n=1 Tax=Natronincola ferrireducens TaxID=393762 RepID=A0A1G8YRU6_9FIRM|nr:sodium:solute symporter family protein [Natronincola ferrireducens]SDK05569.1 Na+/proline symporter [Natronincola ferrireducens]